MSLLIDFQIPQSTKEKVGRRNNQALDAEWIADVYRVTERSRLNPNVSIFDLLFFFLFCAKFKFLERFSSIINKSL